MFEVIIIAQILTATARRMPRPVGGDEGGRMEIEIYLPMQSTHDKIGLVRD